MDPAASPVRPSQIAYPIAAPGEIASPGRRANAWPVNHAATATTATTTVMAVAWAVSFCVAMRRLETGVTATKSRLPRRASATSVTDSARIDHSPGSA